MVKVEVTEQFTLQKFDELKNLVRFNPSLDKEGWLYENDTFECNEKMADYLTGNNDLKKSVVKIIEVIPDEVKAEKPKTTRKTTTKKK